MQFDYYSAGTIAFIADAEFAFAVNLNKLINNTVWLQLKTDMTVSLTQMLPIWLVEISVNRQEQVTPIQMSSHSHGGYETSFDISLLPHIHHLRISVPVVLPQVENTLSAIFFCSDSDAETEEVKPAGRKVALLTHEQKQKSLYVMVGGRERFD